MRTSKLEIATTQACELVNITKQVKAQVKAAGIDNGALLIFCPHTTAGVMIQEYTDPDLGDDLLLAMENAVPAFPTMGDFKHAEANSHAHAKAALVGASQVVPVEKGKLLLGSFQAIFLCEFDGPRSRQILLKMLGD